MKSPTLVALLIFLFFSCSKDSSIDPSPTSSADFTAEQLSVLEAIQKEGVTISSNPLTIADDELTILDELRNARIVGLGEATHGTKEFFQMKHRVFQYLVENHGFKAFLFEMDLAEARIFNDWVQWRRKD